MLIKFICVWFVYLPYPCTCAGIYFCSSKAKHVENVIALNDSCLLNVRMEIGCYFIANLTAAKQYYTCGNPHESNGFRHSAETLNTRLQMFNNLEKIRIKFFCRLEQFIILFMQIAGACTENRCANLLYSFLI